MVGLPLIILFGFSLLIWFLKKRHFRSIWILSLTAFILSWVATIILTQLLPSELTFSRWEPQSLFLSGLGIEIDLSSIALASSCLTLGLVMVLTLERKQNSFGSMDLFSICWLVGFGLLTIIPGSVITFCLAWVLWEIVIIFINSIVVDSSAGFVLEPKRAIRRLISVPLALAVGVLLEMKVDGNDELIALGINMAFLLGLIAVLLRIDLDRNPISGWNDQIHTGYLEILIQGISAASGFALLGRLLTYGSPTNSHFIFVGFGVVLSIIGILRLMASNGRGMNMSSMALTILGVGILLELLIPGSDGRTLMLLAATMVLVYSAMMIPNTKRWWNLFAALSAASLVIGLPGSIGGVVAEAISGLFLDIEGTLIGSLIFISLFIVALNLIRSSVMNGRLATSGQTASNFGSLVSTSLLLITGMLMGMLNGLTLSPGGVGIFAASGLLLGISTYAMIARGSSFEISIPITPPQNRIGAWNRVWLNFSKIMSTLIQSTAKIFEGRAGLLWVYVIMQLILVAIGITQ